MAGGKKPYYFGVSYYLRNFIICDYATFILPIYLEFNLINEFKIHFYCERISYLINKLGSYTQ